MLFVNNIAEIVHAIVDRYAGAANKNIGDAFLLVWKMNPDKYTINDDGSVDWKDRRYVEILADCALISFMKIQAKINREPKILAYRNDARLLKRMPGYKVKMGFGLHLGWGIEGAIGTTVRLNQRIRIQDRCIVLITQRQHGISSGGGNKTVWCASAHLIGVAGELQVPILYIRSQAV
jgi:class 3 adenylate cyclase